MLYRYREGGRNRERNRCILRISPPPPPSLAFCTEAKVAKRGVGVFAGHYGTHKGSEVRWSEQQLPLLGTPDFEPKVAMNSEIRENL